jgi:prepilin-type N-terminal cleavage/methylation domain-containing protein
MARPASISIIKSRNFASTRRQGFTLVELMIASVLSLIVFAALFSAYIFMARNLARIANFQQQQVQNRRVLFVVAKDVDEAVQVTTPLPASLILTLPPRPPSPDTTVVTYTYDSAAHTLTRVAVTGALPSSTTVLLSNLTSFTFAYFDESGGASPPPVFIKQIALSYSSAVGDRPNGTQSGDSVVSSRMVLRSKPPLGQ